MDETSIWARREQLRAGLVSSSELVREAIDRAESTSELGAFVSLNPELALEEAAQADMRIAAARRDESTAELAPLLGVPTAHKDLVAVRGTITTHGSLAVPHVVADADDPVAAVTRAAGAVSIGKTQVPEFGIAGYSENELAPPARNPHDPSRTAGGSSGGTAAAIAAGVLPAAIASDAGGSIRIPSAACGLIGLKPGRGVVPADRILGPGLSDADWTPFDEFGAPRMGVSGPIVRSVKDAALLFDVLTGEGATLPEVQRILADPSTLSGLRVGVSLTSPFASWIGIHFDPSAQAAVDAAVTQLESAGHAVEEARIDYDPRYPEAFTTVWTSALTRISFRPGAEEVLGGLARMFLERAHATSREELAEATAALRAFADGAAQQWAQYDVVLTPALAFTAPQVGEFRALGPEGDYRLQCEWAPQASMVNVVGAPAITVPTLAPNESSDGLPRGVQLIGRGGSESQLLQLAAQLSRAESSSR